MKLSMEGIKEFNMNDEWYTPNRILSIVKQILNPIDVDPASCDAAQERVQARKYYTKETNGLFHEWKGNVWLNPPYSEKLILPFARKLVSSFQCGDIIQALMLVNNVTETKAVNYALRHSTAWCFPLGRIAFIDKRGNEQPSPTKGQFIAYFGHDIDKSMKAVYILEQLGPTTFNTKIGIKE